MKSLSELPEHWREWYHEWHVNVPESKNKRRLQGELLGKPGSRQSYSAAFELFLYWSFKKMGLKVDFQPEINGVNPDFRIVDKPGRSAYVEASVMFSDPLEAEMSYISTGMPIWKEFEKLESSDFVVLNASSSGNPGNVSPQLARREVQKWIDQLDVPEVCIRQIWGIPPYKTFLFGNWRLDVELQIKSPEKRERMGTTAVESEGFSGGYSDNPAKRLRSKLEEKSSQVRKTNGNCIVAITERQGGFSSDDVQTALFGENCEYDLSPYVEGLRIPQPNTDGLWSRHDAKEPIAVVVQRGNLQYPDRGEMELWLNPNSSYFLIPLPLFSLKVCSAVQKVWTRPATQV